MDLQREREGNRINFLYFLAKEREISALDSFYLSGTEVLGNLSRAREPYKLSGLEQSLVDWIGQIVCVCGSSRKWMDVELIVR